MEKGESRKDDAGDMKKAFTICIDDDARITALQIAIVVKNPETNGLTFFTRDAEVMKDTEMWKFGVEGQAKEIKAS